MPNYTEWIWHGEKIRAHVPNRVPIVESPNLTPAADNVPILDESRTIYAMLQDVFGMHVPEAVKKEIDESARKFYNLVQDADKPLQDKTQYIKLSSIVHLYNLKCVGELSNMIFTSLLELINEFVPIDEPALPKKYV
jgi:hypothetical protein